MTEVESLVVPSRHPDPGFALPEGGWQLFPLPGEDELHGQFWRLYPGPDQGELDLPTVTLAGDLVARWLLKTDEDITGTLISPYVKLDITCLRSHPTSSRETDLSRRDGYNFRLVSLEPADGWDEQPLTLVEFKLLAGGDFERPSDRAARLAGALAVTDFKRGRLALHEPRKWELLAFA